MTFEASAYSAKGIREINEDSFLISSLHNELGKGFTEYYIEGNDDKLIFFVVADGMGGQGSGEKASNFVITKLKELSEENIYLDETILIDKIENIHSLIIQHDSKMGSTLSGIILQKNISGLVNLGDSRTYRLRNGMFLKLTNDDSLKKYESNAASNIITNGIGGGLKSISVNCRFSDKTIIPGDIFLMCSDGVHGYISDDEIENILSMKTNSKEMSATIVQKAITNGSDDNCTAIVVIFKE